MDKFLEQRKNEYSRYLYASLYPPKMVKKILDQTTGLTKDHNGEFVHTARNFQYAKSYILREKKKSK